MAARVGRSFEDGLGIGRYGRSSLPSLPDLAARQQVEGWASTVSQPGQYVNFTAQRQRLVADYRGPAGQANTGEWWRSDRSGDIDLEWLTAPVPKAADTTFTFAGSSQSPEENAYPANRATLVADGVPVLSFDLGLQAPGAWIGDDGWVLEFRPKQVRSAIDGYHRQFDSSGCSGIYRLGAPAGALRAGEPLRLRVVLEEPTAGGPHWFAVMERNDVGEATLDSNQDEIEQLQHEVIRLKQTVAALARRTYSELFPDRLDTEDVIVYTNGWKHVHPPDVELLANGDLLVAFREGSEHLAADGQIVTVRSRDGGKTWGDRQVVHGGPGSDIRDASIAQLRDGSLMLTDFANGNYDAVGHYMGKPSDSYTGMAGGTYVGVSSDLGASWTFQPAPLDPAPYPWIGTTERVIELSTGELVMATYFVDWRSGTRHMGCALYRSTDRGETWSFGAEFANIPGVILNEPALIRTPTGRLLAMIRSEAGPEYYDAHSDDDGHTWSEPVLTGIPGRANPASLVCLPDGTVLCV